MSVNYENTYWNHKGRHSGCNDMLTALIPESGPVPNFPLEPERNKALETYRIAVNCYYDLYNNGLCNRAREFRKAFGFSATKLTTRNARGLGYALTQELIDRTEARMDEIILAAYAEQFPAGGLPKALSAYPLPGSINNPHPKTFDITPVGCQTPEGNARVHKALDEFSFATAEVANAAEQLLRGRENGREDDEDWKELKAAIKTRTGKQDAFMRAVAGVPDATGKAV